MIDYVGRKRILLAWEWMDRALAGKLQPGDVCLTFDDGPRSQLDIAYPIMKSLGLTGFWFVYTAPLQGEGGRLEMYHHFRFSRFKSVAEFYAAFDRSLASSEYAGRAAKALSGFDIRSHLSEAAFYTDEDRKFRFIRDIVLGESDYYHLMDGMLAEFKYDVDSEAKNLWLNNDCLKRFDAEGHIVGLHSHTHPTRMGACTQDRQAVEYSACADHLTSILGKKPIAMSHPCNSYSSETFKVLRRLGIKIGFRANMAAVEAPCEFEYPRADTADIFQAIGSQ